MMSQHMFPEGSVLDANHVILYKEALKAAGRVIGPPLARASVSSGGQNFYAAQQLFTVLFEAVVVPNAQISVVDAQHSGGSELSREAIDAQVDQRHLSSQSSWEQPPRHL